MSKENQILGDIIHRNPSALMLLDKYYTASKGSVVSPDLIVGLELEIEQAPWRGAAITGFEYHEDGSLRNQGGEYVTLPTKLKYVENLLTGFYKTFKVTEANYSERCSTHVHINMCDMTLSQIAGVCALYQVFEGLLFKFVGNNRDENIFCVPWRHADIGNSLIDKILKRNWRGLGWQKYTSLNVLPLLEKGTLEFRHLYGTCDVDLIMTWLNILACMVKYARENGIERIQQIIWDLNTNSAYEASLRDVFGVYSVLLMKDNYKEVMELDVIQAKLVIGGCYSVDQGGVGGAEVAADADAALNNLRGLVRGQAEVIQAQAVRPQVIQNWFVDQEVPVEWRNARPAPNRNR